MALLLEREGAKEQIPNCKCSFKRKPGLGFNSLIRDKSLGKEIH